MRISAVRKDIAQVKTVMRERRTSGRLQVPKIREGRNAGGQREKDEENPGGCRHQR